jgi:hypothetical protein
LPERGLSLLNQKDLGAAQIVARTAQEQRLEGREQLNVAVNDLAAQHPDWQTWGGGGYHLAVLFARDARAPKEGPEPLTDWAVRAENRQTVLELLRGSASPAVQELLHCRALTETTIFSPSQSASGQALDAALCIAGLLVEEKALAPGLSNAVFSLAWQANHRGNSGPLEQALVDLMSLGQRFNWGQEAAFVSRIEDAETLRLLAHLVRNREAETPLLFSAVQLSGKPAAVAGYLMNFSQTGMQDIAAALPYGEGGVNEMFARNQRPHSSALRQGLAQNALLKGVLGLAADYCWQTRGLAFSIKWLFYLAGGFLLAAALHFSRPAATVLEQPLQVRGFHIAREILFALGFLLVVLLLSEPFLAQESQKTVLPFRLRLPTTGGVAAVVNTNAHPTFMNNSLLTLLLFFVLQGLLYTACVVKLAEIRRQHVPARVKLKLLENEDHLFDAGLYLGFVGTVISLILFSLGVIKFSLMAAYSSTSFGIIFVSFFKIFHLRPARRKLLLETEAGLEPEAPLRARLAMTS